MTWGQIAAIVLLAVIAVVVALCKAYAMGKEAGESEGRAQDDDAKTRSLFGDDVSVSDIEQGLLDAMPESVVVCDSVGSVCCASDTSSSMHITANGWIDNQEILDILRLVESDGVAREREVCISLDLTRVSNDLSGRGVQAGTAAPSDRYVRVRVDGIGGGLYGVFLNDVTEQRRFETMRRDFVTNVSHELKTPAGAISLLAETITDACDDPKAVRYFAGRITKESARLTELVHHLIELQRAQDTGTMIDLHRVSTMSVVREAIGENLVQAQAKGIALRLLFNGVQQPLERPSRVVDSSDAESIDSDGASVDGSGTVNADIDNADIDIVDADDDHIDSTVDAPIMVDREMITTAVKNLVENAIRYSPSKTTVAVGVSFNGDKDTVTIHVVDQGIGIPAASLDRVFERFYRVDPARSRATGGSGLGLAITKHCVQECGGTISVWSREGEGSTFTIELPAAENDAPSGSNSEEPEMRDEHHDEHTADHADHADHVDHAERVADVVS